MKQTCNLSQILSTRKPSYHERGFTLVETLVATSIFVLVIGVTIAAFGFGSATQSRNLAIRETSQHMRFIIESIARDIRLANDFTISSNGDDISLIKTNGDEVSYNYILYQEENIESGIIQYIDENGVAHDLNSPDDMTITDLSFTGVDKSNELVQSYVKIKITFRAKLGYKQTEMQEQSIETTVTTRAYNKGYENITEE